ncbi:hypothetical protein HYDPIDRAFT_99232, partial [Hydnomerulius pinastri MD-312]
MVGTNTTSAAAASASATVNPLSTATTPSTVPIPTFSALRSHAITLSAATLPHPGTKSAPIKFKGDYTTVKRFLQHYERLLIQNNVTSDNEKCENITQYCSTRVSKFIEVLSGYRKNDWAKLKDQILDHFDADKDTKRYKPKDLQKYVKHQRTKPIRSLAAWKKYTRNFVQIADWLLSQSKISDSDYSTYVWKGIHRQLQTRIEDQLLASDPLRDMTQPFDASDVASVAQKLLQRDRFDSGQAYSDSEDSDTEDNSDSEDSDSESESSDSESEESEEESRKHKQKSKCKSKTGSKKVSKITDPAIDSEWEETSSKRTRANPTTTKSLSRKDIEVEQLISQMSKLGLDDPKYGMLYFRALKLDSDVRNIVSKPAFRARDA